MTDRSITVLKFGGSVLRDENDLPRAVHDIYRQWRRSSQVLAVVSTFGGTTNKLIDRSRLFWDDPQPEALAALLSIGEATSAALLVLALKRAGVPAKLLSPEQVGILTTGDPLDAEPVSADLVRLRKELKQSVVVVSGFAGVNSEGDLTLLGRGGTDFTALFLAKELTARCVLIKDVDGLYVTDPSNGIRQPRRFARACYNTTLRLGDQLIQPKAVRFAQENRQCFEITGIGSNSGTLIGEFEDELAPFGTPVPLRVALLGCGTVGGGVYERLSALSSHFEVIGVVNLDQNKALAAGIRLDQLERDARTLIEQDCDVVVELIGGIEPARSLIKQGLKLGRHVITANKALMAEDGYLLEDLAGRSGVTIRYSASVGGSLPALEAVSYASNSGNPIAVIGIINGTCNFICDQLSSGVEFGSAVKLAQQAGYAEADPTFDIDGTDAAQKLVLLARGAFGVDLPFASVNRTGIEGLSTSKLCEAGAQGRSYRLVAECRRTATGFTASVKPIELPTSHPFAQTKGVENCLSIETESGQTHFLKGHGAGRYPTTESVVADLFDVRHLEVPLRNNGFLEVSA
jgi:homoserine dehydrogenase